MFGYNLINVTTMENTGAANYSRKSLKDVLKIRTYVLRRKQRRFSLNVSV